MLNRLARGAFARLAISATLLALVPAVALADECQVTHSRAREIGRKVMSDNPDASYTEYSGDEAKKIIDAINSTPPVSAWDADTIIVIDAKDGGPFRIGLIVNDCVTRAMPIPREVWPDLVRTAIGEHS